MNEIMTSEELNTSIPMETVVIVTIPAIRHCPPRRWIKQNVEVEYEDTSLNEDLYSLDWMSKYEGDRPIPKAVVDFMNRLHQQCEARQIYANYVRFEEI